jgi:hypothetical protein
MSRSPCSSMVSISPVHKLFAFSPWLNCCRGVILSLSPCTITGLISNVRPGLVSLSACFTALACTSASAELRVPMLTVGNCVLADVLRPCVVDCDGVRRSEPVAEAMAGYKWNV